MNNDRLSASKQKSKQKRKLLDGDIIQIGDAKLQVSLSDLPFLPPIRNIQQHTFEYYRSAV